jgi:hypothetical protein
MAKNGKEIFNSDICISITGYIESYCYVCIIYKEKIYIKKINLNQLDRMINKNIIIKKVFELILISMLEIKKILN